MPIKEPPTAAVMRSLQQLEGLLPLLDEITDPPSVAAIARRIAGLAATIANKTTTAEFAAAVLMVTQQAAQEEQTEANITES